MAKSGDNNKASEDVAVSAQGSAVPDRPGAKSAAKATKRDPRARANAKGADVVADDAAQSSPKSTKRPKGKPAKRAASVQERENAKKSDSTTDDDATTPANANNTVRKGKKGSSDKSAKLGKRAKKPKAPKKPKVPREPLTAMQVVGRVLPVLSLALGLVAIVLFYRHFMPQNVNPNGDDGASAVVQQAVVTGGDTNTYQGLEDKWLASGLFTTGDEELDRSIKTFCDALAVEGSTARANANNVYNTIVWSVYEERTAGQEPAGTKWALECARHYFEAATPAEGLGGSGDEYDFSAAISYCMRYFGFYDALAVPIVKGTQETGQTHSALVVVSNEYGMPCVCDPSLSAEGFMLDRNLYDITVEDIGQDLTTVEALGLTVQKPSSVSSSETSTSISTNPSASSSDAGGFESDQLYD